MILQYKKRARTKSVWKKRKNREMRYATPHKFARADTGFNDIS